MSNSKKTTTAKKKKTSSKSIDNSSSKKRKKKTTQEIVIDDKLKIFFIDENEEKKENTKSSKYKPTVIKIETGVENPAIVSERKEKKRFLKKQTKLLLLIFTIIFIGSAITIYNWFGDNKDVEVQIQEIINNVEIVEVDEDEETGKEKKVEVIKNKKVKKEDPYFDYIKMKLINVDFTKLKETNSDVKGWIQVNGTNINYPFVQTNDNDYYLSHSFDKSNNKAGWIFLDYRNNLSKSDKNTIIYGHSRVNGSMFGSLKDIMSDEWLKNKDNYVIKLSTEKENTLWQIFSAYYVPTTNDYLQVSFLNDDDFLSFANTLLNRSSHNFNTSVSKTDKILTLSTCHNNSEKTVIHAKLIKKETK